ncbi:anti-sigma factor antagonist [bacterium]|nr:anti-sigma factor antagonist [bacterium]
MLQIDQKEVDGVTVLALKGRLILGNESTTLAQRIKQTVADQVTQVLLNLAEVPYIDSYGVGELIASFTSVRRIGGTLRLCSPRPAVLEVLQLVKLPMMVEVHPTEEEALAGFAAS